jgi:hypothetical protein
MFSVDDRDRVCDRVLKMASSDPRVVAGAVVGGLAHGGGDRWSDLDLTFGVADRVPVHEVLADWTREISHEFDAVHLFDVPSGSALYRVFLLPGCLQLDLSFTPASEFGARGPKFMLLFGSAVERPHDPQPSAQNLFGLGVHHAVHARVCIERGRWWQAEYWISGVRDQALSLACRRRGLNAWYGRGFDDLPGEVLDAFSDALVRALKRDELLRALRSAIAGLLRESTEVQEVAAKVEAQLRELTAAWGVESGCS